jgi:hypothetical protein
MTKKHYEAIASILRGSYEVAQENEQNGMAIGETERVEVLANELAAYFTQDNPRFNREMFLTACGIEQS